MGAPEEESDDPLAGHERYRTVRTLGEGGMGQVLEAEHVLLGTRVVAKVLHERLAGQPALIDRIRLEAQALARLTHPNLVRVTDFDVTAAAGRPFLVMELLKGRSLREELAARGKLPVVEALALCRQALAGLGAAHEAGLIHRDIKLDNLFVCDPARSGEERTVKVLDFGVAKVRDGSATAPAPLAVPTSTGVIVGTPRFFSPEQARGSPVDHRGDIYAMGLVLYMLLAGQGPFDDAINTTDMARAHVFREPDPPSKHGRGVPPELDAIVLKALAKDPTARFASATAFAQELERIQKALEKRTQPLAAMAPGSEPDPLAGAMGWAATERISPEAAEAITKARAARIAATSAAPTARSPGHAAPPSVGPSAPTLPSPGQPAPGQPARSSAPPPGAAPVGPEPTAATRRAGSHAPAPTAPAMPATTPAQRTAYMAPLDLPPPAPVLAPTEPMRPPLSVQRTSAMPQPSLAAPPKGFSSRLAIVIVLLALAGGGIAAFLLLRNM
ncbi:MAG: protein kinase [Polyangiaceae bacterium]|nr:protein kinase [Polyangiaceae bacterium]